MKFLVSVHFLIFIAIINIQGQIKFDDYFKNHSLRVDFILAGDSVTKQLYWKDMKKEPDWGGNRKNLIDTFEYGDCLFKVFDAKSGKLIYSRGFGTLFNEWQTTVEANYEKKAFEETITFPFPKSKIILDVYSRNDSGKFKLLAQNFINPDDYFISEESLPEIKPILVLNNGPSDKKVDIVFIAEGYTKDEMNKFKSDIERFSDNIFSYSPYKEYKSMFNIWAVGAISEESNPDIPAEHIYHNTALDASFYTFNSERYIMTYSNYKVRDYAALVPYDQIFILVNSTKYGGGSIYNHYSVCTSDNEESGYVSVHEFGHGFAGLADEYYNSSVAYEGFYNFSVEPWEPNITTLINFGKKWKDMVEPDIPIPTPEKIKYINKVGVYEGGGYSAKGIFRPYQDCIMKSKTAESFCPVCKRAIVQMILFDSDSDHN